MDQIKIGRFIAEKRKEKKMTQVQLAEKLGITDRAVSKWETGKSLPDASIMLELCGLLGITVNDLLSGEVVSMNNYNDKMEKNLIEAVRQKEQADKRLLSLEVLIGMISTAFLISMTAAAALIPMQDWIRFLLIGIGVVQFIVAMMFAIRIEQTAGYYECQDCGHSRTRYMKCPQCGKKSWQKKVLSSEVKADE